MNRKLVTCILILLFITGCTIIDGSASEELKSLQTNTPYPTYTCYPTHTTYPTQTPYHTQTPQFSIVTSTFTSTPTSMPGILRNINCADKFMVKIFEKPLFQPYCSDAVANGEFIILKLEITNLTGEFLEGLHEDSFKLHGSVNGDEIVIAFHNDASWQMYYHGRLKNKFHYIDEQFYSGITTKIVTVFDIPKEIDRVSLVFEYAPKNDFFKNAMCSVKIPIHEVEVIEQPEPQLATPTITPTMVEVADYVEINWRELVENAEDHLGEKVIVRGDVFNIVSEYEFQFVFAGTFREYGYVKMEEAFGDLYEYPSFPNFVTVYGEVGGYECYESILSKEVCPPLIIGDAYKTK